VQSRPVRIAYRAKGSLVEARDLLQRLTGWDLGPNAQLEELADDQLVPLSGLLEA